MIEFDVRINSGDLYDYMMRHTYNGFSGLLGSVVGALLVICGIYLKIWMMLGGGVLLLLYLPITLFLKSKRQYLASPVFKEPLHYKLDEEGIHVSQKETEEMQAWDNIFKAVSTSRSIIVYTSRVNACIFPKRELGDDAEHVIRVIAENLPAKKMKIKQ